MAGPATAPTARVPVKTADGRVGTVEAKDVAGLIDSGGKKISDRQYSEQQRKIDLEAKYEEGSVAERFEGAYAPGVAARLRGFTAGLSDVGLVEGAKLVSPDLGERVRQKLGEYKEYAPVESKVGEILGLTAGVAASGGARAGLSPAGAIARVGAATERAVIGELGGMAGRGLAERAVMRSAALGTAGALEGGAYGVGHTLSEASLGNHEVTADKLLAGAKGGALYGLVGGAVLGGGSELVGGALRGGLTTFARAESGESGTVASMLERKAGEFTLRSAGADKTLIRKLDRFAPGGHEGVGKLLAEEAPALVGKQRVGQMSKELWQEAAIKGKQTYGHAMDAVLESGTKAGGSVRVADVVDDIRAVSKPFRDDYANLAKAGVVKQIDGFADQVARRAGLLDEAGAVINADARISLKELHGIRRAADDLWAGNKINPIATPIKGVRDAVDGRLVSELERAGGEELKTAWKDATTRWQAFHALEKAAANASAKSGANQFLSLTDKIFAAAGSAVGSVVGGGPVGALLGGAVTGLASKALRSRFDAVAADALLKASQLGAARRLTGAVDAQIESGVRGFLAGTGSGGKGEFAAALPQGAKAGQVTRTEFEKLTQQVANAAAARKSSPGFAEQEASKKLGAFATAAPNVTAILANRHAAAVDFLSASMPRARVDESAMYVPSSLPSPKTLSPEELRWVRRHEATTDPMGVIRDMQKGRVTHDQIDALKAVYPSLYQQVKTRMIESVQGRGKAVSVEQATQLGILLGEPTHFMLRPEYLAAMQASKGAAVPVAQAEGPAAAGPRGKPDFATDAPERATTMQEDIEK